MLRPQSFILRRRSRKLILAGGRRQNKDHEDAVEAAEQAVALGPNFAMILHCSAMTHIFAGNFETAREYEEQAIRLNPVEKAVSLIELARIQYHLGDFEDARVLAAEALERQPRWMTAQTILLAALWRLGRKEDAREIATKVLQSTPKFSVARWSSGFPYKNADDLTAILSPLLGAGLPE
jgi:adenylate cyclase